MLERTRDHRSEAAVEPADVAQLRKGFRGDLVLPGDPSFDEARKVWNGMVDKSPAAIAYCAGRGDVAEALAFARSVDLPFSVRGGGHNIAGKAVCEAGLVIDLSRMKGVAVDAGRRTIRAEAGLILGEFDATTQDYGLATTMGVNSDTGMAGLTLGGGFGKLGRKYGLACDNLLSAEIVLAEGRLVRASAEENADLFWGIRGGGGNFGIVTALEFRLHPVGPIIPRAAFLYEGAAVAEALRRYHEFASSAPDEVSADAALVRGTFGTAFSVSVCHAGPPEEGGRMLERMVAPLREKVRPASEEIGVRRYLDLQSAGDSLFVRGRRYYWRAQFLNQIGEGAITAVLERFAAAPSELSIFVFQQVGGAISRVPPGETAYGNRDAAYDSFPIAIWESPADDEANIAWARELAAAVQPFATGGVYVNNLGEEGPDRVRAAYGENYDRLAALKMRYDPENLFRNNQNVQPT